jgi:hypothetical protein
MAFDWSSLGLVAPTSLADARVAAHHAAQWPTRAARANLAPAADDSHSAFAWDPAQRALVSRPMDETRIGLRIEDLELIVLHGEAPMSRLALEGRTDREAGAWLDVQLAAHGLKPASAVELPYAIDPHPVALDAVYRTSDATRELARWYAVASETLESFRAAQPGASPVRCWPHHFDIATLVLLDAGGGENARSVGIGVSPGDASYAQPYAYVSPWPYPDRAALPPAPRPGHWHVEGFVAVVATGEAILAADARGTAFLAFVTSAYETARASLGT